MEMNLIKVKSMLPDISNVTFFKTAGKNIYIIVAAGFEDRALGFLQELHKSGTKHNVCGALVLNYLPHDPKNDRNREQIYKSLHQLGIPSKHIKDLYFDRENPLELSDSLHGFSETFDGNSYIYLDISAMSKLALLYFLNSLWQKKVSFSVIYTEAQKFGPSKEEYLQASKRDRLGQNMLPELLFSGIYEPVIPNEFSGSCPLTTNRALIAFLGYNKRQIMGVASMIPYQFFVPIIGQTTYTGKQWDWRPKALIEINNSDLLTSGKLISNVPNVDFHHESLPKNEEYRLHVSNFDYRETLLALLAIYEAHKYRYSLTIAPLGTKMHTVGIFLFTQLFPATQVVYAPPRDFHLKYSEGVKAVWEIPFSNPTQMETALFNQINPHMAFLEKKLTL